MSIILAIDIGFQGFVLCRVVLLFKNKGKPLSYHVKLTQERRTRI